MSDLPVIGTHGTALSIEHSKAVSQGTQDVIRILNDLPVDAMLPVLNSAIVSMCMSQEDPISVFAALFAAASRAIDRFINTPPAGTA